MNQLVVERFLSYVAIDSETGDEKAFADHLAKELKAFGGKVWFDQAGDVVGSNTGNLYAFFSGDLDKEPLLFSCHMDTVKPGKGIKPVISNGKIYSDGTTILGADDKAGIAALMQAIHDIRDEKQSHRPFEVVLTIGEEVGLLGSKNLDYGSLKSKEAIILDSGGPVGKIIVQAPYQNKFSAVIRGKTAHAGVAPENGISALLVAAKAVSSMKLLRIDEETTANIGTLMSESPTNIVSDYALIKGEIRSLSKEKLDAQTQHMVACVEKETNQLGAKAEIQVEVAYEGYHFDEQEPIVSFLMGLTRDMGITPQLDKTGGGSDANIYNQNGIKAVNMGIGSQSPHSLEELLDISELEKLTALVKTMMVK